jgi:ABC-type dipeptide/oligopeptide/nickel transport system permease component
MSGYLLRRFLASIFAIIGATLIVFSLSRVVGDPRMLYAQEGYGMTPEAWENLGKQLGLDKPLIVQYFVWFGKVARGDLGTSLIARQPVSELIGNKAGNTLQLGMAAWMLAILVGIPLGILSAVKRGSVLDLVGRGFAALGQAAPPFWVGIMGILFFAVRQRWLPTGTMGEGPSITNIDHFIMPAVVLAWQSAAGYLRLTRSAMLEVLDAEFIKFARAKGVPSWKVIWKHAFKNALIPPLTLMALLMAGFITGAVVVETVFTWPGMGKLAVDSIMQNDFPVLTGVVLLFAATYIVLNFLADIAYGLIDPRIRYT